METSTILLVRLDLFLAGSTVVTNSWFTDL